MERGPLYEIIDGMVGSDKELDIVLQGEHDAIEIQNVVAVEALNSAHGLKITTKQNYIWLDASHVSAAWQARDDI